LRSQTLRREPIRLPRSPAVCPCSGPFRWVDENFSIRLGRNGGTYRRAPALAGRRPEGVFSAISRFGMPPAHGGGLRTVGPFVLGRFVPRAIRSSDDSLS